MLRRLRRRDDEALTRLVETHGTVLTRAAWLHLGDDPAAEDAVQGTPLAAWDGAKRKRERRRRGRRRRPRRRPCRVADDSHRRPRRQPSPESPRFGPFCSTFANPVDDPAAPCAVVVRAGDSGPGQGE
ncbi:MAG: hypothetical protein ACOC95_07540 [Planctomycetota bacterium]